jgi:hypothetical protein
MQLGRFQQLLNETHTKIAAEKAAVAGTFKTVAVGRWRTISNGGGKAQVAGPSDVDCDVGCGDYCANSCCGALQ